MRPTVGVFLLALFAAAFLLRLGAVFALRDIHVGPVGASSNDDVQFNNLALRTARGDGYVNDQGRPTSFRAPGMPLALAGVYAVFGPHPEAGYLFFCLLGALSCVLTWCIVRELSLGERAARLAGVLSAVYLPTIYFATTFESENVFIPLLALGVWLFLLHLRTDRAAPAVGGGLALGLAALTRPFALLLLPILLGVLVLAQFQQGRRRVLSAAGFAVAFLAVLAPWTARNYFVHGRFVLVASNGGSTFYGGNNGRVASEPCYFGYWLSTTELPHREQVDAAPDEITHDKVEWRLGLDWLRAHPAAIPQLAALKLVRLCVGLPDFDGGRRTLYYALRIGGYAPFFVLFVLGAGQCCRRRAFWSPAWLVIHGTMLATLATAILFWGSPRFRDANAPVLMAYAVVGWEVIACRFWPKKPAV